MGILRMESWVSFRPPHLSECSAVESKEINEKTPKIVEVDAKMIDLQNKICRILT